MGILDFGKVKKLAVEIVNDYHKYTQNYENFGRYDNSFFNLDKINEEMRKERLGSNYTSPTPKKLAHNEAYAISLSGDGWDYVTQKHADMGYFAPEKYVGADYTPYSKYGYDHVVHNAEAKLVMLAKDIISIMGSAYDYYVHYTLSSGYGTNQTESYQVSSNYQYSGTFTVSNVGVGSGGRVYVVICKKEDCIERRRQACQSIKAVLKAEKRKEK